MTTLSYVLYCVQSNSKGCESAIRIIDGNIQLKKEVHIQDVKLIEKPSWLTGVPVLAKIATKEIWEGSSAIDQLNYLSGYYSGFSTAILNSQPWEKYVPNLSIQPTQNITPQMSTNVEMEEKSFSSSKNDKNAIEIKIEESIQTKQQTSIISPVLSKPSEFSKNESISTKTFIDDKTKQTKDPNRLQPMPSPDDPQKSQDILLPPLPPLPKREIVVPERPTIVNIESKTNQSIQKEIPQSTASENRRSNRIKFNNEIGEESEIIDNQHNLNIYDENNNKNLDKILISEILPPEKQYSEDQEKNLVFSKADLEEIENVMAKPKTTINKRQTTKKQNTSRQVPFSTRKILKTNVIKDEFSNESAEDE
jgi:hypothetical protein